ncbi:MAG: hypothetical protein GY807_06475 [Gammaproteobacteria bacterium]|nr:hypothetical protein [Gammaproteobacteria bacterium]
MRHALAAALGAVLPLLFLAPGFAETPISLDQSLKVIVFSPAEEKREYSLIFGNYRDFIGTDIIVINSDKTVQIVEKLLFRAMGGKIVFLISDNMIDKAMYVITATDEELHPLERAIEGVNLLPVRDDELTMDINGLVFAAYEANKNTDIQKNNPVYYDIYENISGDIFVLSRKAYFELWSRKNISDFDLNKFSVGVKKRLNSLGPNLNEMSNAKYVESIGPLRVDLLINERAEALRKLFAGADGVARLPWPLPQPTRWHAFQEDELGVEWNEMTTLGDVETVLVEMAEGAGFHDRGYFLAPGGFAMTVSMEAFDEAGRSLEEDQRFVDGLRKPDIGKIGIWGALFNERIGRFRCFLFVATDGFRRPSSKELGKDLARDLVIAGDGRLTKPVKNLPFSEDHEIYVFIYEYRVTESKNSTHFVLNSDFGAMKHLTGSGLMKESE